METLVRVTDLSRRFGARLALSDVNLALERGHVLGLLGPNGAGKTTCLRLLAGVLAPSAGRIEILGLDLAREGREARRHLGYLPDRPPLYPELRVDEYLRFCARLRGIPRRRIAGALDEAKHRCGLDAMGRHPIARLSKGFRQRLGLAQAIIHRPRLLILDEPTEGLDPYQMRAMRALIRELAQECGVIFSSHLLPEVQAVCDRVAILHQGRMLYGDYLAADQAPHLWRVRLSWPSAQAAGALNEAEGCARLTELATVHAATALGEGRFRVVLADGASSADLSRDILGAGLALYELQPERSDLERIFFDLTGAEDPQ
ncbi:MAG: ABC transporter ATP-binding protein [Chromatiaceae bacterium]|nr:ABC transporter ATP-binding protein [Chromatiaceae bacterium]